MTTAIIMEVETPDIIERRMTVILCSYSKNLKKLN